jgi:putative transposase
MKKSRFTETQIVGVLKEAESGLSIADLLRNHGISSTPFTSGDPIRGSGSALSQTGQRALAELRIQNHGDRTDP